MIAILFFDSRHYIATSLCIEHLRQICRLNLPGSVVGLEVLLQERGLFFGLWANLRTAAFPEEAEPLIVVDLAHRQAAYRGLDPVWDFHYRDGDSSSDFLTVTFEEIRRAFEDGPRKNYLTPG